MICPRCGCTKPCACDNYTPDYYDECIRCGCHKPCQCDSRGATDEEKYGEYDA